MDNKCSTITESFIQTVCSFFRNEQSCRGYDLESPLGRIADIVFKHWNDVSRKTEAIERLSTQLETKTDICHQLKANIELLQGDIIYYKNKLIVSGNILKNLYKVKWSETDSARCQDNVPIEEKQIQKERVFSADTLKEAREIANQKFGLCSFTLHRYNEELGDFDEEDLAWKIASEKENV